MPEIQTQTPLENEPICDFCLSYCESGGNSIEPYTFFSNPCGDEPRCCDDCNNEHIIPVRLELQRRDFNFCHRCSGYTREWKPIECIYCHKLTSFCNDCSHKIDDSGYYTTFDNDDDDKPCGETRGDYESSDEESSDNE